MLLNELVSNQYTRSARKYLADKYPNLSGQDLYMFFQKEFLPTCLPRVSDLDDCKVNGVAGYYTLGVVRLKYESDKNGIPYNKFKMGDIINELSFKNNTSPTTFLTPNFSYISKTGKEKLVKTVDELYKIVFGKTSKDEHELNTSLKGVNVSEDGKYIKVGRYTIYNVFTYNTMKQYVKLPSNNAICYVGNLKSYHKDESHNGMRAKFACIRDDYREIEKSIGKDCPFDDYGLSLIIISISPNGKIEVCSRWNNGINLPSWCKEKMAKLNRTTASNYLTKEEVEKIVLNGEYKFEDVFMPWDEETYNFRRSNINNIKDLSSQLQSLGGSTSKNVFRKEAEELHEPVISKWLRDNGRSEYPFKNKKIINQPIVSLSESDIKNMVESCVKQILKEIYKN